MYKVNFGFFIANTNVSLYYFWMVFEEENIQNKITGGRCKIFKSFLKLNHATTTIVIGVI